VALGGAVVSAECWDTRVDTMLQTRKFLLGKQGMAKFANGLKGNAHGGRQGRL